MDHHDRAKLDVSTLLIEFLDEAGLIQNRELSENVQLYITTDEYNKMFDDVLIAASVTDPEVGKFVVVNNGRLVENEEETNISHLYLDKPKAGLLYTAILNAFPEFATDQANITFNQKVEAVKITPKNDSANTAVKNTTSNQKKSLLEKLPDTDQSVKVDFAKASDVNEAIGQLKMLVHKLETLRGDGYHQISFKDSSNLTLTKKLIETSVGSDQLIDAYLKNKEHASVVGDKDAMVKSIKNSKNKETLWVSSVGKDCIKLRATNLEEQVREKSYEIPSKSISLDKESAVALAKIIKTTFGE